MAARPNGTPNPPIWCCWCGILSGCVYMRIRSLCECMCRPGTGCFQLRLTTAPICRIINCQSSAIVVLVFTRSLACPLCSAYCPFVVGQSRAARTRSYLCYPAIGELPMLTCAPPVLYACPTYANSEPVALAGAFGSCPGSLYHWGLTWFQR